MNCIKCGRETVDEDVFCQDCLLEMEKYPVQPGTVVLLPRRKDYSYTKKNSKRHVPSVEEQIAILRKQVGLLIFFLLVAIACIAVMFKPTMHYVRDEHFEIGQNYSSVAPAAAPNTPTPTE